MFLGLLHSLGDLARSLNDLSLKIFLSKDSPPLGMSGCSEKETIVSSCKGSAGRTVFEKFSSSLRLAARARTSALVGGQHGSETVERCDDSLARGCGRPLLEQCLGLSDSSPHSEDCPTPSRGFCQFTENICFLCPVWLPRHKCQKRP